MAGSHRIYANRRRPDGMLDSNANGSTGGKKRMSCHRGSPHVSFGRFARIRAPAKPGGTHRARKNSPLLGASKKRELAVSGRERKKAIDSKGRELIHYSVSIGADVDQGGPHVKVVGKV